jgi:hypothetical protein
VKQHHNILQVLYRSYCGIRLATTWVVQQGAQCAAWAFGEAGSSTVIPPKNRNSPPRLAVLRLRA